MWTSLETLAFILIVLAAVKMFVLLVKPKAWLNFAKAVYAKPAVTSFVALILAAIVLYYLVGAGITIVQILAVTVFVVLLLLVGLAPEIPYFLRKYEGMIKKGKLWQQYWLYTLIWVALLVLGLIAIF